MNWWRATHGMMSDPRLRVVANIVQMPVGQVFAVWMALHEHASDASPRGSVADVDPETLAVALGWDASVIASVIDALTARRMIVDGQIDAWAEKHGAKFDRTNAARQRAYRLRHGKGTRAENSTQDADNGEENNDVTDSDGSDRNALRNDSNALRNDRNAHRVEEIHSISDTLSLDTDITLKNIPLRTARAQALGRKDIWDAMQSCGIPAHLAARSFNHAKINAWLEAGLTGHQLGDAIRRAYAKRQRDNDDRPINIGLVDCMIADVLAGRAFTNATRSNDDGDELSRQFAGG